LAGDINYALSLWPGLTRFLEDGRLELDTNPVENQIRPLALTEPRRDFRRLQTLREWSHDDDSKEVFT
jgi:hypothetical protein